MGYLRRHTMTYYNTTKLSGTALVECEKDCQTQEAVILNYFNRRQGETISPSEIFIHFADIAHWPITSIRRAITNLTEQGKIVKTNTQRQGLYGKPEHCWRLSEFKSELF